MPLGAHKAAIMGVAGVSTGDVVLLSTQTASNSASISFTSGIDSTYGEYIFKFYNINPATDATQFGFQGNASSQSGYNETITSTYFYPYHYESDSDAALGYDGGQDQAQGTAFQSLSNDMGSDADQSVSGTLHLFDPSSTTYVKHFYSTANQNGAGDYSSEIFATGYFNVTAAITNIQFKMSSGNFDGKIKLWGVK
jgi:hypothetical protein